MEYFIAILVIIYHVLFTLIFLNLKLSLDHLSESLVKIIFKKHKLENIDWNEVFQPDIDWYQVFIDKVQNAFYVAFPLVKLSRKRSKDKPWITKGIKTSMLRKNSMYKSPLRNKNNINKCEYRAYCNKLTKNNKTS